MIPGGAEDEDRDDDGAGPRRVRGDRRGADERLGEHSGQFHKPAAGAHVHRPAGGRGVRPVGRPRAGDAVLHVAGRRVAHQVGRRPRAASAGLRAPRVRRLGLGEDRRPELRGDARIRYARLHQHPLSPREQVAEDTRPRHRPARQQPRLQLQAGVHRPRGVGRTRRDTALRGRGVRLLRLGQREVRRLRRGLEASERVRRHAVPQQVRRGERPRRPGLQVVRRQLSGGPGHVPVLGHLPRRVDLGEAEGRHLGLRGEDPASQRLQGRRPLGRRNRRRLVGGAFRRRQGKGGLARPLRRRRLDLERPQVDNPEEPQSLVRREAVSLHARHKEGRRHPREEGRHQGAEDRRQHLPRQRPAGEVQGREPARDESGQRTHRDAR